MKEAALYLKPQDSDASPKLLRPIPKTGLTVGRNSNADVQLEELRCNGLHVLIEPNKDGSFNVIDLGSHYGTFKNNAKFDEEKFNPGEQFRIGTSFLYIDFPSEPIKAVEKQEKKDETPVPRQKDLAIDKTLLQVSMYWGQQPLEVRTFETGAKITIGASKDAVFNLPMNSNDDNLEPFTLASYKDAELTMTLPVEVHGLVWIGTDTISVDSLRHRDQQKGFTSTTVKLRVGDRAHLEIGELSLEIIFITPAEKLPMFEKKTMDPKLKQIMLSVFGFWFLVMLILSLWTPTPEEKTLEDVPEHLKKVLFDAGIADAIKKQQSAIGELANNLEGGRARGEEGRATANKDPNAAKPAAKTQTNPPKAQANANAPKVTAKDISSAFSDNSAPSTDSTASIVGEKQLGNTASALKGGNFARGTSGFGSGGGGESVGVGQLKGLSTGGGMGAGNYGLAPSKGREVEAPVNEETEILGGLDPDVISAVVKRYLPQVRHCYEQQLTMNPNLKGKVKVSFLIKGDGEVGTATIAESTMNNKPTEDCILEKVKTWQFPKPKGGGSVMVKYPFLLMSNSGN
jgi:hypothetical protein